LKLAKLLQHCTSSKHILSVITFSWQII